MSVFFIILTVIVIAIVALMLIPIPVRIRLESGSYYVKGLVGLVLKIRKKNKLISEFMEIKNTNSSIDGFTKRLQSAKDLYYNTKPELTELVSLVGKTAKVSYYRGVVTLGFDDPMNTGVATGLANAFFSELDYFLDGFLKTTGSSYLSVVPNFNSPGFDYVAELKVKISLLRRYMLRHRLLKYMKDNRDSLNIIFGGSEK